MSLVASEFSNPGYIMNRATKRGVLIGTVAWLALAACGSAVAGVGPPPLAKGVSNGLHVQNLAVSDVGGFAQYRIPALAATTRGTLIAAYDGRPSMADLPNHIAVLVRRSTDGGKTWGPQQVVRQAPAPAGFGDASLIVDRRTGRIFLFYAASVHQGYVGSHTGNDPRDPNVLQADYSYSDDDGATWHARRITAQIKNPAWGGLFASSGEGIQLRQGPHAGRLIQQYVVRIGGHNYAASAYSDDDGATWAMGQPVGPGMDENKSVGLADGSVLLDVRDSPKRQFALSRDGGETWSRPHPVDALTDPGDNGSIIRYAPEAPASDPRSHWLLESNTDDPDLRRNLVVRQSCDDGKTWPIVRVVEPGSAAYSTLTMLPDGRIGLLYERNGYQKLSYTSFDIAWLRGVCAPLDAAAPSIVAGSRNTLRVTLTNQTGKALPAGVLSMEAPRGWLALPVPVAPVAAGRRVAVALPYTASTMQAGKVPLTLHYDVGGKRAMLQLAATVEPSPSAPAAPSLSVLPVLDHVSASPASKLATYWIRATNVGNVALREVTLTGNLRHLDKCKPATLAPGASALCAEGVHAAEASFEPRVTATGIAPNGIRIIGTSATNELPAP